MNYIWLVIAGFLFYRLLLKRKKKGGETMAQDEEEQEVEEEPIRCEHCKNKLTDRDGEGNGWKCEACGTEPLCDNCCVGLGDDGQGGTNLTICKKCIDEAYPRKETIVEKIKLVTDNSTAGKFDPGAKTKFD
jgi:hypothetical protein